MDRIQFVYVSYIAATPERIWQALTDEQLTKQYWQHNNVSDWRVGSRWEHRSADQARELHLVGKVLESMPPRHLVLSWAFPADERNEEQHSRVTIDLEPYHDVVRLILKHERLAPHSEMLEGITAGWPKVLSSLKSLLETGRALPRLW